MTRPEDQALLSELEAQLRELNYVLGKLETARSTLVPPPASFWRGAAGRAYEAQRAALAGVIGEGILSLGDAKTSTELAVAQVMSRV